MKKWGFKKLAQWFNKGASLSEQTIFNKCSNTSDFVLIEAKLSKQQESSKDSSLTFLHIQMIDVV